MAQIPLALEAAQQENTQLDAAIASAQASVAAYQAQADELGLEVKRLQQLIGSRSVSQQQLDKAAANYQAALAQVEAAILEPLDRHRIIGPVPADGGRGEPVEALRLIEKERCTYFVGVPTMSREMMQHPDRHKYDLSSLEAVSYGGAPSAPELVRKIREVFGALPGNGWGMTETMATVTSHTAEDYLNRPDSCGPAVPVCDLKIMDAAAVALCRDNKIPIVVFNIREPGNLARVLAGDGVCTVVGDAA